MLRFFSKKTSEPRSDDLLPVVLPTKIVQHSQWPGPFARWNDALSVTWAHFQEPCNTIYLTKHEAENLISQKRHYQTIAINNLRSRSHGRVWSHIKEENGVVFYLGLLHEDGLGPSRLLLGDELRKIFPDGYSFCIPERTCAFVFSSRASDKIRAVVQGVVSKCFQNGREPVAETIFEEHTIR